MEDTPIFEPDEPDEEDDEEEGALNPISICRHCGDPDCTGLCYSVMGLNTP